MPFMWMLQAVTGLHAAGVLHRDIKPENMLLMNDNVFLNDFDVSCLISSSEATLCSKVGTDDFRSPLWQAGEPYGTLDDLASFLLSFAWLLCTCEQSHLHCGFSICLNSLQHLKL